MRRGGNKIELYLYKFINIIKHMSGLFTNEIFNDSSNYIVGESGDDLHGNFERERGDNVPGDYLWSEEIIAFSLNCGALKEETINKLKNSNQILMPLSALNKISTLDDFGQFPLFFEIQNKKNKFSQVCGIYEFTAPPGVCHLPYRVMDGLGIKEGDVIKINLICPVKGSYIKFRLHNSDFAKLSDPKAILEKNLSQYYPVLTEGHTISIEHLGKTYYIDVLKCEPAETIQIINTNVNVDFDKPLDYVEPIKLPSLPKLEPKPDYDTKRFPGKGNRLGSS